MNAIDWMAYDTDKQKTHSYVPLYRHLVQAVSAGDTLMEVGVNKGGSLLAFRDMLLCEVVGVDVKPCPSCICNKPRITFVQADAYSSAADVALAKYTGMCSAVIDDGSHLPEHMLHFAMVYHKYLKPGGLLVVEDVCSLDVANDIAKQMPKDVYEAVAVADMRATRGKRDDILVLGFKR